MFRGKRLGLSSRFPFLPISKQKMKNEEIISKVQNDFNRAYPNKCFFTLGQMIRFAKECLELKDYGDDEDKKIEIKKTREGFIQHPKD